MRYEVRRKDRQISREEAMTLLDAAEYAVLSLVGEDGVPYGIPVNLVRSGNVLIFHCALEGRKQDCLRHQPRVSVCAVGRIHILPGQFSTEYESVVVEGVAEIVEDENRKIDDLMMLVEKYDPQHLDVAPKYIEKSLSRTGIVEIHIESVTGKAKRVRSK